MKIISKEQNEIVQEIRKRIGREMTHLKILQCNTKNGIEVDRLESEIMALGRVYYSLDVIYTTKDAEGVR